MADVEIIIGGNNFKNVTCCPICGDSFAWKRSEGIRYKRTDDKVKGFIICQECFETASDEQIMSSAEYYTRLWKREVRVILPIQNIHGRLRMNLN